MVGTGKTFLGSVIATNCSITESGHVLACAPSNYAADGIATKIAETSNDAGLRRSVLRIYSTKREQQMTSSGKRPGWEKHTIY